MLANGAKLGYAESGSTYTDLPGLKEIPDMGASPEKVENTALTDSLKHYEMGIGDSGDINYVFRYENGSADSIYRVLRGLQDSEKVYKWCETLSDGTKTEFEGPCSVTRSGGSVNGVVECTLTVYLQSDLTITDPS